VRRCAVVLVHHPVLDGKGATVTTAVTNLDVHDLARSARTYDCSDYFVAHPILAQRELVERIRAHWMEGSSGVRIPDRREAIEILRVVGSLDEAILALGGRQHVEVWATAARERRPSLKFEEARTLARKEGRTLVLVFGTGWGLAHDVIAASDQLLEPVRATVGDYNHLSVRSACAIVLDRLFGAH